MTDDRQFLANNYPIMSGAARFMLSSASLGADGMLHTVANAHETQWHVDDPVTDVAAMQALFPASSRRRPRLASMPIWQRS
jgi:hypothetical protein